MTLGKSKVMLAAAWLTCLSVVPAGAQSDDRGGRQDRSSSSSGTSLFDDSRQPLFSGSLFSDEPIAKKVHSDIATINAPPKTDSGINAANNFAERKIQMAQVDDEMRRQMRGVAQYMRQYCLWNSNRFPGQMEDQINTNDNTWGVQVQLSQLYPNNPYNYGPTEVVTWGIPSQYNENGSPATGSPVWGDDWTNHLQNAQNNRFVLQMNTSMTAAMIDQWTTDPPYEWTAPPGTITTIGNNQGLYVVWGAGADGKPIKNPLNGKIMIIAGSTSGTVNDQHAPEAY